MEYFQDGIEWVGDHTNFTSKVIEIPRPSLTVLISTLRTYVKQLTVHTAISVMSTIKIFTNPLKLFLTTS